MAKNKTSEVEQRLRSLFILLRTAINTSVETVGLSRKIPEDGIVFHIGNTSQILKAATGPNIKAGAGYFVLWPDSKRVDTKRTAATVWVTPGIQDYVGAAQVVAGAMMADLEKRNTGHDTLPELLRKVSDEVGITKGGKVSKALAQCVAEYVETANLGAWPLPGLSRIPVKTTVQGRRHEVKAFCAGLLNPDEKGNPVSCTVENERAKPSKWYRGYHPSTAADELAADPAPTCWLCGGPIATHADLEASRKDRVEEKIIEIPA